MRICSSEARKNLFFEKKKQKTFAPALLPPGVHAGQLARNQTDKSFLVLFFKKEHSFFLGFMRMTGQVLALSGGVGGAKLALGLAPLCDLIVAANTGDDFEHLGLHISPDIDTLLYVLSGRDDAARGWGRGDETWHFMAALQELGGETWFQLGDRDLAVHVERTRRLHAGETLSAITASFAARFGVTARLLPMSDDQVRTRIELAEGWIDFQRWFVGLRCEPPVRGLDFAGAATAQPHAAILAALADPGLRAVIICPSNPLLSIGPILAMPALRAALARCTAPVVAVSPIIGGRAVKGPTVKMMRELGLPPTAAGVAACYEGLIDGYVLDVADRDAAGHLPHLATTALPTLMITHADRVRVAQSALALADSIRAMAVAS
jgi:LPPG:FO 2-phospho-L-lactate transferase